jgi:ABC-2 type transport system permease protein
VSRQAWRSYALLLRWQLLRQRQFLPLLVAIQIALGVGVIYGFSFLVPKVTPNIALFFATGAPTLSLILVGLTVVPQETSVSRSDGRQTYVAALPVPRLAPMLAEVSFWLLVQLPGSVITLVLAALHFDVHLRLDPLIIPAIALVSLTSAAVGYAIAVSLPPTVAAQIANFLGIALLLFSPINYPLERLPQVLQHIHEVLPVTYMADIVRGGLSGRYDANRATAFGVVAAYCVAGLALSARAAARRR